MRRQLKYVQAINEAIDICMARDPSVYIMGLGVPDPKGIFGTTIGLQQKHGNGRVLDIPVSENGMTGIAIGSALAGMRPILTHQRVDFALLSMEQIVNQAAKWHYMFGGQMNVPMVIRLIIGRGWGQGPQHSQSLHSWFAHIPGLKVVMPTTPHDAKGLLISAIEDNNPVIFIEHRWLHALSGPVPEGHYRVPIGQSRLVREGTDLTIVGVSHMTIEAIRASELLLKENVAAEVIDVRTLNPMDNSMILESVRKTGRLLVADIGWTTAGIGAEIIARVTEEGFDALKSPPRRISLPDVPCPTTPALANSYYKRASHIVDAARAMLGKRSDNVSADLDHAEFLDVPDPSFTGPF